jgi:ubiquinol-cytochrome c reductase iron-sulfur subunit
VRILIEAPGRRHPFSSKEATMSETTIEGFHHEGSRRDFLYVATTATSLVGAGAMAWPLLDSMNPSADLLARATTEIALAPIEVGQSITVEWQGKPVFVRRRTEAEIALAQRDDGAEMRDPEPDSARVQRPEWLVLIGICTHLGCIPLGYKGEYGGWLCPCHGSHYDTSGRIRKGPAPRNLDVPPYGFATDALVIVG